MTLAALTQPLSFPFLDSAISEQNLSIVGLALTHPPEGEGTGERYAEQVPGPEM